VQHHLVPAVKKLLRRRPTQPAVDPVTNTGAMRPNVVGDVSTASRAPAFCESVWFVT
jgi:hypothetical protein